MMKIKWMSLIVGCAVTAFVSCGNSVGEEQDIAAIIEQKWPDAKSTDSGLKYVILKEGNGEKPKSGAQVKVHYVGTLLNGVEFDSSVKRGEPLQFSVGIGDVIKGWDEILLGMSKGEKRTVIIPPELGYGARGAGGAIPPNATLVFEMELLDF